jgi:hypothetical protein
LLGATLPDRAVICCDQILPTGEQAVVTASRFAAAKA